jgi:hypothetical protein
MATSIEPFLRKSDLLLSCYVCQQPKQDSKMLCTKLTKKQTSTYKPLHAGNNWKNQTDEANQENKRMPIYILNQTNIMLIYYSF